MVPAILKRISILVFCMIIFGCGDSAEETSSGSSPSIGRMPAGSTAAPDVELSGEFEISAPAPFGHSTTTAELTCQEQFPGSPFRATWNDSESKIAILVTGFRDANGSAAHKIDNFDLQNFSGTKQQKARLSGATLSTVVIGTSGAVTYYEVGASGEFVEAGTFTASGTCRA